MMFSILIPAYNANRYIKRCLDSVISQNFVDYEVIIVNDGSQDNTLDICREYEKKYAKITVFDQSNHGIAYTRNVLLDKAQGDWIVFIDADDFITPDYLEEFNTQIKNDIKTDVIICNYSTSKNGLLIRNHNYCTDPQKYYHYLLTKNYHKVTTTLWAKTFRRALIERYHLRFSNKFNMGEDLYFLVTFFYQTKNICFINKCLYNWEIGNEGSMTQTHTEYYSNDNIRNYQAIIEFLKSKPDYDAYTIDLNIGKMVLRHGYYLSVRRGENKANPYVFDDTSYSGLSLLNKMRLFCINNDFFNLLRAIDKIF